MLFGYARTSTVKQELGLQGEINALEGYGIDSKNIFIEQKSGKSLDRPVLNDMLSRLREGDTVVITSLDRLSRKLTDLIALVDDFNSNGIALVSLKEGIDSSTPQGRMFLQMAGVFAEFEREMISLRTKEALEVAKANGNVGGRPKADESKIDAAMNLYKQGGMTVSAICDVCGIARPTFYKYKKELGID